MKNNDQSGFENLDKVFESLDAIEMASSQGGKSWIRYVSDFSYWFNKISLDLGFSVRIL